MEILMDPMMALMVSCSGMPLISSFSLTGMSAFLVSNSMACIICRGSVKWKYREEIRREIRSKDFFPKNFQ